MSQLTLFDGSQKFTINKPIRLIELFGGYGSQSLALKYLGVKFEHWKLCEWAVKSIQAYKDIHFAEDNTDYSKDHSDEFILNRLFKWGISANYNEPMTKEQIKRLGSAKQRQIYNNIKATHNLVNISQVKGEDLQIEQTDKYCYIMTYSYPCQDLSKAGKGAGMAKGSGTRSGLLWEVERILDECNSLNQLPQVLLMENVPDVIGSKNIKHFAKWLEKLETLGYKCYWKILNAKDFGIPQNRERCFMISILGDYYYEFPEPIKLEHRLKDLLEENVDEKYYLSDKMLNYIVSSNDKWTGNNNKSIINRDIACAKTTREGNTRADTSDYVSENLNENCNLKELTQNLPQAYRVYDPDGLSVSLVANGGGIGAKTGLYAVKNNLKTQLCNELIESGKVKENDVICHSYSTNRMQEWDKRNVETNNISPTLDTRCDCLGVVVNDNLLVADGKLKKFKNSEISGTLLTNSNFGGIGVQLIKGKQTNYRIRKLTPKECFRLMGVKDEDFDKISKNQSNASLYHLAGDSIVVNVLMAIFGQLFDKEK